MPASTDSLQPYRAKRDFGHTPEPKGEPGRSGGTLAFVVQKHAASRLHYDFRLELDGVMLSWAVPKGPSFDPQDKRMAVRVEDHPISYNAFEGTIPKGQYGAGHVLVWDRGSWSPLGDPHAGLDAGKLVFTLRGHKLAGLWELVRIGKPGDRQMAWLLFKKRDEFARPKSEYDVVSALPDSVAKLPEPAAAAPPASAAKRTTASADLLRRAAKAALPAKLAPQLATLATGIPHEGVWQFEIKLDGYRLMTRIGRGAAPQLVTRGGHDWSGKMPQLRAELAALELDDTWLDGEIVVLGASGTPDFNALQLAFDQRAPGEIVYFVFDMPFCAGHDLRPLALHERRRLLRERLERHPGEHLRFSESFDADPAHVLESARRLELEGVIAKRADAPYVSARTATWLKLKTAQRQEFVVGGFTDRNGERDSAEIGSLLLGVHEGRTLRFVGGVGTGWDAKTAAALKQRLLRLETKSSPFADDADRKADAAAPRTARRPARAARPERWVKPQLVVEVGFGDWTPAGQVRHARFEGVREDKPAKEVVREGAVTPRGALPLRRSGSSAATGTAIKVTHPERVIDRSTGLTKLDLVRYYESIAERLVPHLKGRPCSLLRSPDGVAGKAFFQKHLDQLRIAEAVELDPALWPEHEPLLEIPTPTAIAAAAQMNVIEFHTWNARIKHIDQPDRMVFDLDPGDGVAWTEVREAATLVRSLLGELGLSAWLKTSGGKGLHVVVPLAPRHGWATVKDVSQAIVQHLAQIVPQRFVAKSGPANRKGRIFVDYLRNSHGATTAAAFSARARPGLGVSMPVDWDALDSLKSGAHWTIATAREHVSFERADPWAGYWKSRQTLAKAMKLLGLRAPG